MRARFYQMIVAAVALCAFVATDAQSQRSQSYRTQSPDSATELRVDVGDRVTYSVTHRGKVLLVCLTHLAHTWRRTHSRARLARALDVDASGARQHAPRRMTKSAVVRDRFAELRLRFENDFDLEAQVSGYVLMARRRGAEWYVGAMTNGSARTLTFHLSFLGAGRYTMDSWSDGINADRNAMDYRRETRAVTR